MALIVDAERGITPEVEALLEGLENIRHPEVLVLNKIDLMKREKLLGLSEAINQRLNFEATFMISALRGHGVGGFPDWASGHVPLGPVAFPRGSAHRPDAGADRRRGDARKAVPAHPRGNPLQRHGRDRDVSR